MTTVDKYADPSISQVRRATRRERHNFPCPKCGSRSTATVDTRPTAKGVRRRRHCFDCNWRFSTHEVTVALHDEHIVAEALRRFAKEAESLADRMRVAARRATDVQPWNGSQPPYTPPGRAKPDGVV